MSDIINGDSIIISKKKERKPRNVWSDSEVRYFLQLIKEKNILGLMDGKRLRVSDIFKTLVAPMKAGGFIRDVPQLQIKYKNLKAEYYACKRHNNISGSDPKTFEYFHLMDEILGPRPGSHISGFESVFVVEEENNFNISLADVSDYDNELLTQNVVVEEMIPSCSSGSAASSISGLSENQATGKKSKKGNFIGEIKEIFEGFQNKDEENNKAFLNSLLEKQGEIMESCTEMLLDGMKSMCTNKRKRDSTDDDL